MFKVVLLCLLQFCNAKRLLVVFPVPSWNHAVLGDSIVQAFMETGHESSARISRINMSYKYVLVEGDVHIFGDIIATRFKTQISQHQFPIVFGYRELIRLMELVRNPRPPQKALEIGTTFARRALEHEVTQKLLLDPESSFDVIIAEWYYSELLAPLASIYRCPLIWYSTVDVSWMNLQLMDGHTNPAYSVDHQARSWRSKDGIWDRVARLWKQVQLTAWFYYTLYYVETPIYHEVYRPAQELRGQTVADYDMLVYNASLMLVNSHPLLGQGLPLPQNVKFVGGHHIIEGNNKQISTHLQHILDKSKNGVIFFNLGPNVRSKAISKRAKTRLLDIFGQLEQTVIWKFEEPLQGHSRNIHILKGVPQISLLNHSNTILFITQGDLKSCMEAAYFGVNIIGVPLFGEQFLTTSLVEASGLGLKVEFNEDMPFRISEAISEILGNNSFGDYGIVVCIKGDKSDQSTFEV